MSGVSWYDLDSAPAFGGCCESLLAGKARNFAVHFNAAGAHCALDLSKQDVDALLVVPDGQRDVQQTRWYNFWANEKDKDAIRAIATRYGLSPRLTALLCSVQSREVPLPNSDVKHRTPISDRRSKEKPTAQVDVERASHTSAPPATTAGSSSKSPGFGDVVSDLWHFASVDRGPQYLYVGFNAMHSSPRSESPSNHDPSKPFGLRIWTSLLLCHDGTVVSVMEKPPSTVSAEQIAAARFNVLNIFRHLSKLYSSSSANALMHVSIRHYESAEHVGINDADSASLLFYYLFDDWITTFSLITQKNNPYRDRIELIRRQMFEAADMELIKSLDLLGRQLTTLRLMYQSCELILIRILRHWNPAHLPGWDHESSKDQSSEPGAWYGGDRGHSESSSSELSLSAVLRFERLLDRIRLYALTEVDECLKQKDSLVLMNFNLIALKESQAVEKLTRTTILLAKVTILFLPVSLMTAYFSVQLPDVTNRYDLTTYWVSFAVVTVLSIIALILFGFTSKKASGRTTFKSFTGMFWERLQREKVKRF